MFRTFTLPVLLVLSCTGAHAQSSLDSLTVEVLSLFDRFNARAEKFFKVAPIPVISRSTEAGMVYGLAKFNAFVLDKDRSITKPSRISGVATLSTLGRVNLSLSTDLIFKENKYILLGFVNYRKQPEYVMGIGNELLPEAEELVTIDRVKVFASGMRKVARATYAGLNIDVGNYFGVDVDSSGTLAAMNVTGLDGGVSIGAGPVLAHDSRDNRYNATNGAFATASYTIYSSSIGSSFNYARFDLDTRYYWRPWFKHVLAGQIAGSVMHGDVPFYDLAVLGGENRMRGFYQGILRDKVLLDGQLEYRLPIWKIFGMAAWVGTGRVAPSLNTLSFEGLHASYGVGARIKVDSGNNINLRLDVGFGPPPLSGFYVTYGEAF